MSLTQILRSNVGPAIIFAAIAVVPAGARADDVAGQTAPRKNAPQDADLKKMWLQLREQQQKLDEAQKRLKHQLLQMDAQQRQLQLQQQQINALRSMVYKPPRSNTAGITSPEKSAGDGMTPYAAASTSYTPAEPTASFAPTSEAQVAQESPVGQPPPQQLRPELADVALASQGGVLTPKGVFSFEPSLQYQYLSNNQYIVEGLNIVPGITIGSENVRSLVDRMFTATLGGRLGITDRLEVEAEIPYVYRNDDVTLAGLAPNGTVFENNTSGAGLGDIQFGAHYQLNSGTNGWPYFVANMLVKSNTGVGPFDVPINVKTGLPTTLPTGTGFWALEPSLTMIYPSDPVVFFFNVRDIYQPGSSETLQPSAPAFITTPTRVMISPGDGVGASIGMGFGINDRASFSLAYENTLFLPTTENGKVLPGSTFDVGDLDLGFNYVVSPRISINLGIQVGATHAAPNSAILLRIPIKFQVF